MMTPTIHLNGTSGQELLDQACGAVRGLCKALDAMNEARPNARDYYPQGDDTFTRARDEHDKRIMRVRDLITEYETMAAAIDDAMQAWTRP